MFRIAACLAIALSAWSPAHALRLRAAQVRSDQFVLEAVDVVFDGTALDLRAAAARIPALKLDPARELHWRCRPDANARGWSCRGPSTLLHGGRRRRATLGFSRGDEDTRVALDSGATRIALELPRDAPARLALERVPLPWIAIFAASPARLVPGGGEVSGALAFAAFDPPAGAGELRFNGVAFDSPGGELAGSGLSGRARVDFAGAIGARTLAIDATIDAGAWLVAPLYVELGGAPVAASIALAQRGDGYDVTAWRWDDAGALVAAGTAVLDRSGVPLRVDAAQLRLELARGYPRYLRSVLAGTAFGAVEASGRVEGQLAYVAGEPPSGMLELADVTVHDEAGRFALDGLAGRVPLAPAAPAESTVRWTHASIQKFDLGPAEVLLRADRSGHALARPLELDVLDGKIRIARLELARAGAARRLVASLELDDLSVAALTRALGWPAFEGRLSGKIPAVRSEGGTIAFDGGLAFEVFGGRVELDSLVLERGFGVAPSLAADVVIEDLDLAPLTSAFSFGTIEGRLDGRIDALRLVDGAPVAFDLVLRTDPRHEGRKRISQRAVNSLSTVGGAGAAAGVQRGMLRVFDSFPYAEIGLSCRLANNVCEMGGLDARDGGYTIVRGAGLPRLTVVGHQRRVDWPVLVARLEAATKGTPPIVE
ncbi:MAG TPA: hypothetical protein VND91_09390 [Candidatus Saccharimonadia bacterium]|nr:hypothetical protein [Candidatus Saccharimonadia bacterium]